MGKKLSETEKLKAEIKRLRAELMGARQMALRNYSWTLDAIKAARDAIHIAEKTLGRRPGIKAAERKAVAKGRG